MPVGTDVERTTLGDMWKAFARVDRSQYFVAFDWDTLGWKTVVSAMEERRKESGGTQLQGDGSILELKAY